MSLLIVIHENIGSAVRDIELMHTTIGMPLHHTQTPSLGRGIFRVTFRTTTQFIVFTVTQSHFFPFVGHDKPRVVIGTIDHELLRGHMINVIHTATRSVGSQIRIYEL